MPIEQVAPELERIVSLDQEIEELGTGYSAGWSLQDGIYPCAEGPVWIKEGGYLLFSDISRGRRMKWAEGEGITLFHEPTHYANGLTRDLQGRIVACEQGARRVARIEHDGSATVIANNYRGRRLNRPNDVVVKSDGSIYFTDPGGPNPEMDLEFSGVFRVSADLGIMTLLVRDFAAPNGLAFSVDESVLYVDDSRRGHIRAFNMNPTGTLDMASERVFCDVRGTRRGVPDGMKVDVEGNVYCTASGGVWIIDPSGKHLGTVLVGEDKQATNVGWGGDDMRTLFITTFDELFRIRMNIPGVPVPPAK